MDAFTNCLIAAYYLRKRMNKKKRRYHVHPIVAQRAFQGEFVTLYSSLQEHEEKFFNYFRMSIRSFDELLAKLQNHLKHQDLFRAPVSPAERLAVTLRYLATGHTFTDLHYSYRMGVSTVSCIVQEVCEKIWTVLHEECLSFPNSPEGWLNVVNGFKEIANFPNCVGCIDGKHVRINNPEHSRSTFCNYKKFFSVVLLAVCDYDYCFLYINVGSCGTDSDSAIFRNSNLFLKLQNEEMCFPPPKPLPNTAEPLPYVIIGDAAFGISKHVLRPYARSNMTYKKKILNYRLSPARRYIESTFGIMSNKFRIFHRPMNTSLQNTITIIKACCILHNYTRERDGYRVEDTLTVAGFEPLTHDNVNHNIRSGDILRDKFAYYFISPEGDVSWQDNCIF